MKRYANILSIILTACIVTACSDETEESTDMQASSVASTAMITAQDTTFAEEVERAIVSTENTLSLAKFTYQTKNRISDKCVINWDDEELTELLDNATEIYYGFFLRLSESTFDNKGTVRLHITSDGLTSGYDEEYIRTGISYNSFFNFLCQTFTEDYVCNTLLCRNLYQDYNGELCFVPVAAYIPNDCFDTISFDIIESSENKIKIKATAKYVDIDDSEKKWEHEYYFNIVKPENGWRFDNFEEWV